VYERLDYKCEAVTHTHNPSYSGRSQFQADLGKQFRDPISINKKLGMVVHINHPRYARSTNRRIRVQTDLDISMRPCLKNA
jgi:hypothetical protein